MKLALIVPGGFAQEGGANEIPALSLLAGELAARHEVHVFAFTVPGARSRYALRGAEIHRVEYPWWLAPPPPARRAAAFARLGWQLARDVARVSRAGRFDLFHAFWANEPGLLAGLLGRAMRVPVVLSVGGGEAVWIPDIGYGGAGSRLGRATGALAFRMARAVTVGTDFARSFLREPTRARAEVIPLGIDWRPFDAPPARAPGPPWRLLSVASLNLVKDQGTLLAAFAAVAARLEDVSLDCVGEDALAGQAQAQAQALGLGDRVRFHGWLTQAELVPLYRGAHLHLLSSRYESQGVVVLEAAAAGLPTVGTAVGLLPALAPGAALVVAPGDAAALADAVCALLGDEAGRQAMGAAARAFARGHDAAFTARAFERIYERVAS